MNVSEQYLASVKQQFLYYKTLGEKAMAQLEPHQLFIAPNEDSNSIAGIVKHIHGNIMSRFTDFLTTDGEKEWRNRDSEFADPNAFPDKETLLVKWEEGWKLLFATLDSLTTENLTDTIYIRHEGQAVIHAINRQLAHYPYHVGQIVFYAKQLKQQPWNSLSVPKNKSEEFNRNKIAEEEAKQNFQPNNKTI